MKDALNNTKDVVPTDAIKQSVYLPYEEFTKNAFDILVQVKLVSVGLFADQRQIDAYFYDLISLGMIKECGVHFPGTELETKKFIYIKQHLKT